MCIIGFVGKDFKEINFNCCFCFNMFLSKLGIFDGVIIEVILVVSSLEIFWFCNVSWFSFIFNFWFGFFVNCVCSVMILFWSCRLFDVRVCICNWCVWFCFKVGLINFSNSIIIISMLLYSVINIFFCCDSVEKWFLKFC